MAAEISTDKPRTLSPLALETLAVVRLAARRGRADMTMAEILYELRKTNPCAEKSSLSRELTHLGRDGLLLLRTSKRKSAWEIYPKSSRKISNPASSAYYVPGAGRPPAVMTATAAPAGAGRGAVPAAGAVVPAGQVVAVEPDFY